jgi:hypothetical protein
MENQWAYPRVLHGVFGHPHYGGNGEELGSIEFTLQHTDYKLVGAYRKFTGDHLKYRIMLCNAWQTQVAPAFSGISCEHNLA